jgi:hypothetical protein
MRWEIIMNGDFLRIWKEVVVTYFKISSQHLFGETEKNHKKSVRISGEWVKI